MLFIDRNHINSAFHSLPDQGVLAGADRHHQLNLGDLWIEKGEVHHQHVVGGHTTHIREVEVATDLGHRRYVEEVDILIVDQGLFPRKIKRAITIGNHIRVVHFRREEDMRIHIKVVALGFLACV